MGRNGKGTCPKCGSTNCVYYADGHIHCYSAGCGYHKNSDDASDDNTMPTNSPAPVASATIVPHERLQPFTTSERGLKPETLKRYEYQTSLWKGGEMVHVWPLYDQAGEFTGQRIRFTKKKDFAILNLEDQSVDPLAVKLFGMTVWGDANDKRVVVTEGELDAMSIAQCASFKYPVVSVNGGAQNAAANLKANYRWLDRFDEIILWLDDDEEGRKATEECAKLFAVGKVKIAKLAGFKDANEALQAKKFAEIEQAVYAAVGWRPRGIINAAGTLSLLLDKTETPFWRWPFQSLQDHTGGCLRGKVIYHVAGTGVGKTTTLIECLVAFTDDSFKHTEEPAKVGYIGFENNLRELLLDILTVPARQRLKLDPVDDERLGELHSQLFGSGRWELFDTANAEWTIEAVVSYIRYLVKALGCNIIVLDPLSAMVAMANSTNERQELDHLGMLLARYAKELNVSIHVAHHLTRPKDGPGHEEGGKVGLNQVRGSGGIANHADGVLGYERNQQAENDEAKSITIMRSLKWRHTGFTGVVCYTKYDTINGQTSELSEQEAKKLLGGDAGHGKKAGPSSEFHGMDNDNGDF